MTVVILFGVFFVLLALGLPIALSIGISAIGIMLTPGTFPVPIPMDVLGQTVVQMLYAGVDSFDLLALPLFMLAGAIMGKGGISAQLVDFSNSVVGWVPGGLGCASILASILFAAISGSAAASVAAIGGICIPAMLKQGYPSAFAAAIVAAGGSLGVIIPPSIPMVIFGFLTNTSIAELFMGGIVVGIVMGLFFMIVVIWMSWRHGYGKRQSFKWRVLLVSLKNAAWAIGTPVVVLGGIISGIVTVTEAAAVAVFYGVFVSVVINKQLNFKDTYSLVLDSQCTAATILFIIAMAKVFTWLIAMQQTAQIVSAAIATLNLSPVGIVLLIMFILLIVGCIMETAAALILLVPVLAVLVPQMQIDMVHFGVLMVVNLALGMLTPPVGICLFVSVGIARVSLPAVSRAIMPLVIIALTVLVISAFWSPMIMWLPTLIYR